MKILISRNDYLGDVLLALPLANIIKEYMPGAEVWFWVRDYARDAAEACESVDGTISWDQMTQLRDDQASKQLAQYGFDVFLDLRFSTDKTSLLAKKAKIPIRVGNFRRLYKSRRLFCCNRFINVSRRKTFMHQSQINALSLKALGIYHHESVDQLADRIHLSIASEPICKHFIKQDRFNIIFHMGSNQSSPDWPQDYWLKLVEMLEPEKFNIVLTGSAKEAERFSTVIEAMPPSVHNTMGKLSLKQLMTLINSADGLVGSSTGPTHLSAILNKPTLGLYHCLQPVGSFCWRPMGRQVDYLVAENYGNSLDMTNISVDLVQQVILKWNRHKLSLPPVNRVRLAETDV